MSASDLRIAEKRGHAEAARERFMGTVEEIKLRLAPRTLAQEAWEGAKDKGAEVAEGAVSAVKERPAVAAGVAAGAALILARKPIINLLADLFSDRSKPARQEPVKKRVARPRIKNKE